MINLKSLITKPFFEESFTRKVLSKQTVSFSDSPSTNDFSWHTVDISEEMRPDIISAQYYGTGNYVDILCKYNNISNPFSLERGQVLKIPKYPDSYYVTTDDIIDKGSIKASPNLIPVSSRDTSRLNYLKSLGTSLTQPNLNLPNDKNIKVANGKILFGADVTKVSKADCPTPISRSNVLKNLIESKIFK